MSLSATCQEVAYLTRLLTDILNIDFEPVEIKNDNQGTIAFAKNPVKHHKSKHIDIRYHFIRDYLREDKISISYVPSENNLADIFTKPSSALTVNANIRLRAHNIFFTHISIYFICFMQQ